MGYTIVDFAKSLNVDRCKIRDTPNLIFLCGGAVVGTGEIKSARDYFYRHLKSQATAIAKRIKLAEEINAWFRGGEFPDLLELEKYLADLADITVLFVESPGSIAELGAFAASDILRRKTLAVLDASHSFDRSFIIDGPVKKISSENDELIHFYEWDPKNLKSAASKTGFREMAEEITKFLKARDKARANNQSFDKEKHGHVLLMVADLIGVAGVATKTDLTACLSKLGCPSDHPHPDRYLSLLESMSFIKRVRRSNQSFYVPADARRFIKPAYRTDAVLKEQTKIKSAIRAGFDPLRKRILLSQWRTGSKKVGGRV
jgi:hypothetical protein